MKMFLIKEIPVIVFPTWSGQSGAMIWDGYDV